jgi:hypothetical protein
VLCTVSGSKGRPGPGQCSCSFSLVSDALASRGDVLSESQSVVRCRECICNVGFFPRGRRGPQWHSQLGRVHQHRRYETLCILDFKLASSEAFSAALLIYQQVKERDIRTVVACFWC